MATTSRSGRKKTTSRTKKNPHAKPILPAAASLDSVKLKQLYSTMLGCSMLTERLRLLTSESLLVRDLSFVNGNEALATGALINLTKDDCVGAGDRGYVARFIQGVSPREIFADLFRQTSAAPGKNTAVDSIMPRAALAIQLNQLIGAAWAFKLQKRPQAAVFLSVDPSLSTDALREPVNLAVEYQLPIVFVLNSAPVEEGKSRVQETGVHPDRLPCFVVDALDAVAVYRVAQEAIRRARQGHGPALIECHTWIMPLRASRSTVVGKGQDLDDPLSRMETHLRSKRLWSDKWKIKLTDRLARHLDRAAARARGAVRARLSTPAEASSSKALPTAGNGLRTGDALTIEGPVVRDTRRLAASRG